LNRQEQNLTTFPYIIRSYCTENAMNRKERSEGTNGEKKGKGVRREKEGRREKVLSRKERKRTWGCALPPGTIRGKPGKRQSERKKKSKYGTQKKNRKDDPGLNSSSGITQKKNTQRGTPARALGLENPMLQGCGSGG